MANPFNLAKAKIMDLIHNMADDKAIDDALESLVQEAFDEGYEQARTEFEE